MFDFLLAPGIVAMRLPIVLGEMMRTPSGHLQTGARLESERMITEKLAASLQGLINIGVEGARINWELGQLAATWRPQALSILALHAPARLARAMSQPAQRTLRANSRRLSGRG